MAAVTRSVALPCWLDRPPEEAVEIAGAAERAGFDALWIGEMATFDAFALATAIGLRAPRLRLTIGPLALGVRTPVAIALGVASVATLTGRDVDVALGFGELVDAARAGRPRGELAATIPRDLLDAVGAVGSREEIAARIAAYHDAGRRRRRDRPGDGGRRGRVPDALGAGGASPRLSGAPQPRDRRSQPRRR
jgi:alkanesulfonate monooxygenase SsuD/methylene tetrahydromethanopterin reductase-like flavin-dependent oxidoreductase (luciferase family)